MEAKVVTVEFSDGSIGYGVHASDFPGEPTIKFGCLDRGHAQTLAGALLKVAWCEDTES